jgi:hypothetical protein
MLIKEHSRKWPPDVTVGSGDVAGRAELDDTLTSAQLYQGGKDHITLKLRKPNGLEYGVILVLPEDILAKAIVLIQDKKDQTLREVGELYIS